MYLIHCNFLLKSYKLTFSVKRTNSGRLVTPRMGEDNNVTQTLQCLRLSDSNKLNVLNILKVNLSRSIYTIPRFLSDSNKVNVLGILIILEPSDSARYSRKQDRLTDLFTQFNDDLLILIHNCSFDFVVCEHTSRFSYLD